MINIIKKKLLLVPSAYNERAMGDVITFVNFYKDDFDIYVLINNIKDIQVKKDNYYLVKANSDYANYLKYTADYIIDAGSINSRFKVNRNSKWVSVWHGIPYKKMFNDYKISEIRSSLDYGNAYDLMISMSNFYTNTFLRHAMMYSGEIKEIGCAKVDRLFNRDDICDIKNKLNISRDKKIILYAPTFREKGKAKLPFDIDDFFKSLDNPSDYVLIVKLHYLNSLDTNDDRILDLTSYPEIIDLMVISDMLISDYSSLVLDYALLNKPIILFQYDQKDYFDDRGVYFDFSDFLPKKQIVNKVEDLYNLLKENNLDSDNTKIKDYFYPYESGNSTKKIVDAIDLDTKTYNHKEIIFLVNELNQSGGVHTFVKNFARYYKVKYNLKMIILAITDYPTNLGYVNKFSSPYFDICLTSEFNSDVCNTILRNTDGFIISCQFSSHMHFQNHFGKNAKPILMFHGDTKDVVNKNIYRWHLASLKVGRVRNYMKFVLLTKENLKLIQPHLNKKLGDSLTFIPNSIENKFSEIKNVNNNNFAYLGRLDEDKNVLNLIDIAIKIKQRKLDYTINVYGDGPLRERLEDSISKFDLDKYIHLKGYEDNKQKIFSENEALILVSLTEGMPLVILEAYAYGRPIICYDSFTSAKELVIDEITGYLVKPMDIDSFVDKMEVIKNIKKDDIKNHYKNYDEDNVFSMWEDLFNELDNHTVVKRQENYLYYLVNGCRRVAKRKIKGLITKFKNLVKKIIKKTGLEKNKLKYYNFIGRRKEKKYLRKLKIFPKVSIIVPCYKAQMHIENCINSITNQKYPSIEAIIINDGYEDTVKEYVNKYNNRNLKYFEKENEGAPLTRNYGIEKATGEFIFFFDVDDVLFDGAITSMVYYAINKEVDVVAGITYRHNVINIDGHKWFPSIYNKNYLVEKSKRVNLYKDTLATNKIYRKSILIDNDIRFRNVLYEDKVFTAELYKKIDRIYIINQVIYQWNILEKGNSITNTKTVSNFTKRIESIKEAWNYYSKLQKIYQFSFFVNHDTLIYVREYINYSRDDRKLFFKIIKEFASYNKEYWDSTNINNLRNETYIKYAYNNNFVMFDKLCEIISKNYYNDELPNSIRF